MRLEYQLYFYGSWFIERHFISYQQSQAHWKDNLKTWNLKEAFLWNWHTAPTLRQSGYPVCGLRILSRNATMPSNLWFRNDSVNVCLTIQLYKQLHFQHFATDSIHTGVTATVRSYSRLNFLICALVLLIVGSHMCVMNRSVKNNKKS